MRKYFSTDGIRDVVGKKLDSKLAYDCGNALSNVNKKIKIVIGRDTRISGSYLTQSLALGIIAGGGDVIDVGICTTPCVAYLTKQQKADYGVVISASHNAPNYNGIKIFNSKGYKISEQDEELLESNFPFKKLVESLSMGKYEYKTKLLKKYQDFLVSFAKKCNLKIVLDCGYGASFALAPLIFKKISPNIITINCKNKGELINVDCGAVNVKQLASCVLSNKADIGFAFDGDADRLIVVDEKGNEVDGDILLYIFATYFKKKNMLKNNVVVGTVYTNIAVENALKNKNIRLYRALVGDKYVSESMQNLNSSLGGEKSGHIIFGNYSTTGDGILSAILLLNILSETNSKVSNLNNVHMCPQIIKNVYVENKDYIMQSKILSKMICDFQNVLGNSSRICVRASGTEPKIRIMIESKKSRMAKKMVDDLESCILKINQMKE